MDIVYLNKDGENPELRYSLRTLKNVQHENVWVFGGAPSWLNLDTTLHRPRVQNGSPYKSTRGHLAAACNTADVSDPFMVWNDDFFAMREVGEMPILHRGPMRQMVEEFSAVRGTLWVKGLLETTDALLQSGFSDPVSYDLHVPLVIHKSEMREALRWADRAKCDAVHVRTMYGNVAGLGGTQIVDPKIVKRTVPFPTGPWLSSGNDTFRATVEPVLRYLFPEPSIHEKA